MNDILKPVRETVARHKRNPEDPLTALESSMAERILTLEAEVEALVAALAPFAKLSQPHQSGKHPAIPIFAINGAEITKRDVDTAARLVAKHQ